MTMPNLPNPIVTIARQRPKMVRGFNTLHNVFLLTLLFLLLTTAMYNPMPLPKDEQEKRVTVTVQSSLTVNVGEVVSIQVTVNSGFGAPAADLPVMLYLDDQIVAEIETDGQGTAIFYLPAQATVGEHTLLFQVKGKHGFRDGWLAQTLTVTAAPVVAVPVVTVPVIEAASAHLQPALSAVASPNVPEPTPEPTLEPTPEPTPEATSASTISPVTLAAAQSGDRFTGLLPKEKGIAVEAQARDAATNVQLSLAFGAGALLILLGLLLFMLFRRLFTYGNDARRALAYLRDQPLPDGESLSNFQRLLLGHIRSARWGLLLALGSMVGSALTDLIAPWPLKMIFDYILLDSPLPPAMRFLERLAGTEPFVLLLLIAGAIVLIALLQSSFGYLENYMTTRAGYQLVNTLRRELFLQFQRLSLTFHQESKRGELVFNVADDAQTVRDAFTDSALSLVTQVLTIVGMFAVMFYVNWRLSLIPLITFPLLFVVYNVLQRRLKAQVRTLRKKEGQIASQLTENLAIMPVIQAFGREQQEAERFDEANRQNLESGIRIAQLGAALNRTIAIVSEMGLAAVIFLGAWMALQGTITPGDLLIFISYVRMMYKPVRQMVKMSTKLNSAWVAGQRIAAVLDIEPELEDKPDAIIANKLRGELTFSHVAFHYKADQPVLRDVSFQIKPGQRVAIVGPSGAGKSTITSLLLRLYDPRLGSICIDGVDLRDYDRTSLRQQIGLVLQDSMLFGATIRENICYGKTDATQAEVETAARQAHIHDFISRLPNGYDTPIGETGSTLSGGQRQRIAIARALVKDPSILILDEPTSALDAESKALVDETINHLQWGKTIVVIAHQLSSIQNFDNIIVMAHGRVAEAGTHADLLARRGVYADLYRLQNKIPLSEGSSQNGKSPTGRMMPALVGAN